MSLYLWAIVIYLTFLVFLLSGLSVPAGMWTNAAGHAIEAELVGGDKRHAVLQRPNGQQIRLPLASLSPAARRDAAKKIEKLAPDISKETSPESAELVASHARALFRAGRITADELQATLRSLPADKGVASTKSDRVRPSR